MAATIGVALASAGYDRCSTASNHSLNGGVFGVQATVDALAAAGVGQSGRASSAAEVLPPILVINGVRGAPCVPVRLRRRPGSGGRGVAREPDRPGSNRERRSG